LWEQSRSALDLDEAIRAYARGFVLGSDVGNGINYAFMLDTRANMLSGDAAIADRVTARRVREEVLALSDALLAQKVSDKSGGMGENDYWLRATRAEALFGLGLLSEASEALSEAQALQQTPTDWMLESTRTQLEMLRQLQSPKTSYRGILVTIGVKRLAAVG
jgi:hypothetical protein